VLDLRVARVPALPAAADLPRRAGRAGRRAADQGALLQRLPAGLLGRRGPRPGPTRPAPPPHSAAPLSARGGRRRSCSQPPATSRRLRSRRAARRTSSGSPSRARCRAPRPSRRTGRAALRASAPRSPGAARVQSAHWWPHVETLTSDPRFGLGPRPPRPPGLPPRPRGRAGGEAARGAQ